jgi:hypothetical protein
MPIAKENIKQTKYQSVTLDILALAAAGIKSSAAAGLDDSYDVCDGVAFVELTDGGITNGDYDVSIETPVGTPVEASPIDTVQVDKSTPVNERYLDVLFDVRSGKNAKLLAILPAAAVGAMRIKATFRLRRLLTPISLPKV